MQPLSAVTEGYKLFRVTDMMIFMTCFYAKVTICFVHIRVTIMAEEELFSDWFEASPHE
jgi:hypothetical protein